MGTHYRRRREMNRCSRWSCRSRCAPGATKCARHRRRDRELIAQKRSALYSGACTRCIGRGCSRCERAA